VTAIDATNNIPSSATPATVVFLPVITHPLVWFDLVEGDVASGQPSIGTALVRILPKLGEIARFQTGKTTPVDPAPSLPGPLAAGTLKQPTREPLKYTSAAIPADFRHFTHALLGFTGRF
jgi:hypothetical protein